MNENHFANPGKMIFFIFTFQIKNSKNASGRTEKLS